MANIKSDEAQSPAAIGDKIALGPRQSVYALSLELPTFRRLRGEVLTHPSYLRRTASSSMGHRAEESGKIPKRQGILPVTIRQSNGRRTSKEGSARSKTGEEMKRSRPPQPFMLLTDESMERSSRFRLCSGMTVQDHRRILVFQVIVGSLHGVATRSLSRSTKTTSSTR